jgi:hypothetical protein
MQGRLKPHLARGLLGAITEDRALDGLHEALRNELGERHARVSVAHFGTVMPCCAFLYLARAGTVILHGRHAREHLRDQSCERGVRIPYPDNTTACSCSSGNRSLRTTTLSHLHLVHSIHEPGVHGQRTTSSVTLQFAALSVAL